MKQGGWLILAGLVIGSSWARAGRLEANFNLDWRVQAGDPNGAEAVDFDDSGWRLVSLPFAWNEDAAFKVSIHDLPTGIAWYRKHFSLPADWAGRKVFLEFEGVRQGGEFYVNGRWIGRHENGVMAVGFDVTEAVRFGQENVVAVRTDNDWDYREKATGQRYQWSDRNFNANYGGIPKNVRLIVTDRLYQTLPLFSSLGTTGVYVTARDFDLEARAATVAVETQVRNERPTACEVTLQVTVADLDGRQVARFAGIPTVVTAGGMSLLAAAQRLDDLHFWSWGYGYLYTVTTDLLVDGRVVDSVVTRTGFRQVVLERGRVRLNGRVIQFHGYAQRTSNEWPAVGMSVPAWLSDFSNRLMVEGNANIVRWMHVTPWKQDVESCDRVGLIQMVPAGDAERDVDGRRWQQRVELMRDAMVYLRNHPSVVFYEGGNEAISEAHMQELKDLRDRFDPHGGRYVGAREMLDSRVAEYGGEMLYINKSAGKPLWATEYCRDEGLRKYWDAFSPPFHPDGDGPLYRDQPAREYNRNQDSFAIEDVIRWFDYWRERPGTGTRVSSGGCNIIFSDTNTHYRGAENYRRSGEVDPMRIPKDAYWAHRVIWDAWVDIERPAAHILGHWTYGPEVVKDVTVVSTAERVELVLNGRSLGFGRQSHRFLFTFPQVAWEPGRLEAVGRDAQGREVCRDERVTVGAPQAVKLTRLGPETFHADGADLALVQVEVVDGQGRRCPVAMNRIDFELTGPAQWRGGIAQGPDNFILARSLPVECGVNRVLVRATRQAGTVTLTARSEGLTPDTVSWTSRPVADEGGVCWWHGRDGLPSYLERGPTPAGPSFTPSRRALTVAAVTAGCHPEQAALSFDDNELSGWSNDGRLETAWITYRLTEPARIDEITVKFRNFRRSQYDLQVLVDGEVVWRGRTERNLGYTTLALEPRRGQTVSLALAGLTQDEDAFNIVEITGRRDQADTAQRGPRGRLGIVEIEFYERLDTAGSTGGT